MSACLPASSFPKTANAGEGGEGRGGEVVIGVGEVVTEGVESRTYAALFPAGGGAPIRNGVDSGDADANKDISGTIVGSVDSDR